MVIRGTQYPVQQHVRVSVNANRHGSAHLLLPLSVTRTLEGEREGIAQSGVIVEVEDIALALISRPKRMTLVKDGRRQNFEGGQKV